jgi:CarD family transcriptional regulator
VKTAAKPIAAVVKPAVKAQPKVAALEVQPKPAKTSPMAAVSTNKPIVGSAEAPLVEKVAAVSLNIAAPKVTISISSSASQAESVAAALKKAAEKNMIGKASKTPAAQSTASGSSASEARQDSKPVIAPKAPESKTVAKPPVAAKPAGSGRQGFKVAEFIVYPAHGVGQIITIEEQEVAGFKLELFVISFIKDKMILKVPTTKVVSVGMRKLAENDVVKKALDTLTGRARIKRTMWSRRAQEYEAKINSGDLGAIAEVVRDLYRSDAQPEQSYSERQLYEAALDRLSREVGTVQKLTETESMKLIESQLQKGPRRSKAEEAEGETDGPESEDGEIEEAA